ncbi:Leishmanolysin, putative [Angomonas deanei]|uniref:Leishmanolysin-like peptidase n=1 Tax=Angomonas deanei TaxID=59799 RepID=A0A7G2CLG8_9TRYP|nr:Leishmanolysin, putative [Angomonas deanei]
MRIKVGFDQLSDPTKYCTSATQSVTDLYGDSIACTVANILTDEKRKIITEYLLPKATALLATKLNALPVGNLGVTAEELGGCSPFYTASGDIAAKTDHDFIMLVSASPEPVGIAASALSCVMDGGRRVVGIINIAPSTAERSVQAVRVIFHEFLHALGFGDGGRIKTTIRGVPNVDALSGQAVLKYAKDHYACSSLQALETNKGIHWMGRTSLYDVMYTSSTPVKFISHMTLAAMEDTGYYLPNYAQAETLPFGYHAGCSFLNEACIAGGKTEFPQFFAVSAGVTRCTADFSAVGSGEPRSRSCPDSRFDYFGDGKCGWLGSVMDYCPIYATSRRCEVTETDWVTRCFNYNGGTNAACLPVQCDFEKQTYTVGGSSCSEGQHVTVNSVSYECLRFFEACPYRLSDGLVTLCSIPSCEVCNGDVCTKCNDPLVPSDDGKSCVQSTTTPPAKCDPNCKTCNNGVCEACNDPYVLSTSKTCVQTTTQPPAKCDPNCKTCNNGVCEACNDPYVLSTSKTCQLPTPTCIANCKTCNNGICEACNDPYVLSTSKTCDLPSGTCDPNCKTCNNGVCEACNDPYVLSTSKTCDLPSGTCDPNCKTCNNGVCEACNDPYVLSASKTCVSPSGTCTPNCKTCTNKVCSQCEDAYMITSESSLCVSKIESCVSVTDDGKCTSCTGSRKPSEDGSKCNSKGIPWWVWLIIGLVGAAVVLAIIISAVCCCCCSDTNLYGESKSSYSSRSSSRSSRGFDDSYSDSYSSSYSGSYSGSSGNSSWRSGSSSGRYY